MKNNTITEFELNYFTDGRRTQYLIDPEGKIHRYTGEFDADIVSFHHEIAQKILPDAEFPLDRLMRKGWIRIGSKVSHYVYSQKEPTQAQINTLVDLDFYQYLKVGSLNV